MNMKLEIEALQQRITDLEMKVQGDLERKYSGRRR